MCGRFCVDIDIFREIERLIQGSVHTYGNMPQRDVFPSEKAVVLTGKGSTLSAEEMHWGFLQKEKKNLLINARVETVLERSLFRDSVRRRRCIIPARYFYEWDRQKNKVQFERENSPFLYMAGFYDCFQGEERFIILTTNANDSMSGVHDRMPLLLEEEELQAWVYEEASLEKILKKVPGSLKRSQEYEQLSLFEI